MFTTKHGIFNGDSWEELMQICFRIKYEDEKYQHMPASPGDFGIEGFTRTGKVFQCYCPDTDLPPDELYEKQRDKITKDLKKLSLYETKLAGYLKENKIKEWIFVTPAYKKKELVQHCREKVIEINALSLSIIDADFDIIIHDIDNFSAEIPIALNGDGKKLYILPEKDSGAENKITEWREQEITFVDNAIRKHTKRFAETAKEIPVKANTLTEETVRDFLDGESVLRRWQQVHPENYDKFLILASKIEKEVKEKCMFPVDDNNVLYNQIKSEVKDRISSGFTGLDGLTIDYLTNRLMAYWLLRCPLDFE